MQINRGHPSVPPTIAIASNPAAISPAVQPRQNNPAKLLKTLLKCPNTQWQTECFTVTNARGGPTRERRGGFEASGAPSWGPLTSTHLRPHRPLTTIYYNTYFNISLSVFGPNFHIKNNQCSH